MFFNVRVKYSNEMLNNLRSLMVKTIFWKVLKAGAHLFGKIIYCIKM